MSSLQFMSAHSPRNGKILVLVGLLLTVLLGMVALAIDIGFIQVTRTQLQSASDSGSLAAGTELISGLGASAYRTPVEVQKYGGVEAVTYVGKHPAGDAAAAFIEASRDVQFGKGTLDKTSGKWTFEWGVKPYNAVQVRTQRSSIGKSPGDSPLPLIFAPVLGHNFAEVTVDSVAVILPAKGIKIPPGSGITSGLSPFAFAQKRWEKYWRARQYFVNNKLTASDLDVRNNGLLILDPDDLDADGKPTPLFYELVKVGSGKIEPRQLFDDRYSVVDPALETSSNIVAGEDGVLEANIYPLNSSAGNFGTVDIGGLDNSTAVLSRQIRDGISEQDFEDFTNNTFDPKPNAPINLQGDTGVSAGIEAALEDVVGQCRLIVLYTQVNNPGNNAQYTIVEIVGIRFMAVDLSGRLKVLIIQPCSVSDPGADADYDDDIGDETTFFTPLILAR